MVQFAAVGNHGRTPFLPAMWCALFVSISLVAVFAQDAQSVADDLLPELAAKIATAVSPQTQVSLVIASGVPGADVDPAGMQARVMSALSARGVRTVAAGEGIAAVRVACLANLRERSCTAEVQRGSARDILFVSRPLESSALADAARRDDRLSPAIELRPLFAQSDPILDVMSVGDRLLVLDLAGVTLYQQQEGRWQRMRSSGLTLPERWPRDPRGRLRVEGAMVDAFVPGATCSTTLDEMTFRCVERQDAWPLGVENRGLERARNYFTTPEGVAFYGAATLDTDADARWLLADRAGTLTLIDGIRESVGTLDGGDDVAAIGSPCGAERFVVIASRIDGGGALRLVRIVHRRLTVIASRVSLAATITALWAAPGASAATVVAHDASAGRYDAFRISVSCRR